ncbi:MAG: OsmC family protein [Anaerolineaceae bacterium]|nr:OsmC family protein [Anaerolineaceae bacterium]
MKAKATWQGDMTFTGTADSGFSIQMDSIEAVGGHDSGFKPTELLAIGLAGCTGMDVISILTKKRQAVSGFEVKVKAIKAQEHPKIFTHIEIEYIVSGKNIDRAAVERAVDLSENRYCPSIAMLRKASEITNRITLVETP